MISLAHPGSVLIDLLNTKIDRREAEQQYWSAAFIIHSVQAERRGPGMRSSGLDNLIAYWLDECLPGTVTRHLSEQPKEDFFRPVTAATNRLIAPDFPNYQIVRHLSACNCSYPAHPRAACTCPSCLCLAVSIATVGGPPWIVPLWALAFGLHWSLAFVTSLAPGKRAGLVTVCNDSLTEIAACSCISCRVTQAEAESGGKQKDSRQLKLTYLPIKQISDILCIFAFLLGVGCENYLLSCLEHNTKYIVFAFQVWI